MGMTMTQKILAAHAGLESVTAGQLIEAKLDLVLGNDITTPVAINEFERQNLLDRQRERIAIAKRNGVYNGRKKVAMPDNFPALYDRYPRRELNKGQLAEALHVTRPTLERMIREHLSAQKPENL